MVANRQKIVGIDSEYKQIVKVWGMIKQEVVKTFNPPPCASYILIDNKDTYLSFQLFDRKYSINFTYDSQNSRGQVTYRLHSIDDTHPKVFKKFTFDMYGIIDGAIEYTNCDEWHYDSLISVIRPPVAAE